LLFDWDPTDLSPKFCVPGLTVQAGGVEPGRVLGVDRNSEIHHARNYGRVLSKG